MARAGRTVRDRTPERFAASVTANLLGPYLLARAAVTDMRARGWGRIVNVSTGLVEDGFPGNVSYVAAKSGLHGLTRVMSRELAAAGILTNVVMPGFTPRTNTCHPSSSTQQAQPPRPSGYRSPKTQPA
ncbi:SDR family NAD(P)-dependent oxidoreductase [Catenulispora yoronensis]